MIKVTMHERLRVILQDFSFFLVKCFNGVITQTLVYPSAPFIGCLMAFDGNASFLTPAAALSDSEHSPNPTYQ